MIGEELSEHYVPDGTCLGNKFLVKINGSLEEVMLVGITDCTDYVKLLYFPYDDRNNTKWLYTGGMCFLSLLSEEETDPTDIKKDIKKVVKELEWAVDNKVPLYPLKLEELKNILLKNIK